MLCLPESRGCANVSNDMPARSLKFQPRSFLANRYDFTLFTSSTSPFGLTRLSAVVSRSLDGLRFFLLTPVRMLTTCAGGAVDLPLVPLTARDTLDDEAGIWARPVTGMPQSSDTPSEGEEEEGTFASFAALTIHDFVAAEASGWVEKSVVSRR